MSNSSIIDDLTWRGLIAQSTDIDELTEHTAAGRISLYAGFDPTADSLHAGHLVPLLTLRRFQLAGHRPVLLAGGATGMIGDPRDVGERVMNSSDVVAEWSEKIGGQLERFVDFGDPRTGALMVNNMQWTGHLTAIEFLRTIGKHFSLNTMIGRDTVKRRLEGDGISYTEFSYMLLQANDFLQLRRSEGVTLQIGGSDQWGNIVSGVDLIRRVDGEAAHALTVPLVTTADGKKFGKSTGGGSLWLDPERTSPYTWYQYFLNTADADVVRFLKWFTFLGREEIEELERVTAEKPHLRAAQRTLAEHMTELVHGRAAVDKVELAAQALFGKAELRELDEPTLGAALRETEIAEYAAGSGATIVDLLVETGLCESKGAARRAIGENGVAVNNEKIADVEWTPGDADWIHGTWLVLRRGKKTFAGVRRTAN
ncbi:tyrosine--tRNA ligase [Dietzia sp.]|uniref:tyrosine--tRNA ligase n=1 Tax=Dietzia sp. TaxID=1871616 RepID=UPI002FDB94A6